MTINTKYIEENHYHCHKIKHLFFPKEIILFMQSFWQAVQEESEVNVLWDATEVEVSSTSLNDIVALADKTTGMDDKLKPGKTAIVAASNFDREIVNVFKNMLGSVKREVGVFSNKPEAIAWLCKNS